uniref:Uncharacterized protein n=1 Tax=Caenorhabditis japonica TaxID=281687 RepID=A0A8R1DXY6_CAEJA
MSFGSGFVTLPYHELFATSNGAEKVSRENWGMVSIDQPTIPTHTVQKRRKSTSILAKKRAKMTRQDELITNEEARKVATAILDQIQNTPGKISLDFQSPHTANLIPLPENVATVQKSDWQVNRVQEGQLHSLMSQNPKKFQSLKFPKIQKGKVQMEVLPRQQTLKEAVETLTNPPKTDDNFVGFSVAIANILRKCDAGKAQVVTEAIANLVKEEVLESSKAMN